MNVVNYEPQDWPLEDEKIEIKKDMLARANEARFREQELDEEEKYE